MSYELEDLTPRYRVGVFTNSDPLVVEFNPTSADSRNFVTAIKVTAVSGAGPTYASQAVQTTWDDGTTWDSVTGVEVQDITATGRWLTYATAIMSPISPRCRLVVTPVVGHTITVTAIKKSKHAPGDSPSSSPPNTTGGATTVSIIDPLGAQAEATSVAVALATDQATQTVPLGVRETDGTNWLGSIALAAAQLTSGAVTAVKMVAGVVLGWDGTDHRELRVETTGEVRVASLLPEKWEGLSVAYPTSVQEVYTVYEDAAKTILLATITIDYTDATKQYISSVVRT